MRSITFICARLPRSTPSEAAVLAIFSIALSRRGAEDSWSARWIQARRRLPGLAPAILLFALLTIGSGTWYFYNTHILNTFYTQKQIRDFQANYEKDFKKYERFPQPKIIAAVKAKRAWSFWPFE